MLVLFAFEMCCERTLFKLSCPLKHKKDAVFSLLWLAYIGFKDGLLSVYSAGPNLKLDFNELGYVAMEVNVTDRKSVV